MILIESSSELTDGVSRTFLSALRRILICLTCWLVLSRARLIKTIICQASIPRTIMSTTARYLEIFTDIALPRHELLEIHRSKISLHHTKPTTVNQQYGYHLRSQNLQERSSIKLRTMLSRNYRPNFLLKVAIKLPHRRRPKSDCITKMSPTSPGFGLAYADPGNTIAVKLK